MRGRAVLSAIFLIGAVVLSVAAAGGTAVGGEKAPQWLLDEIAKAPPTVPPDTEAVILLDEQMTEVSGKGALTTVCRRATKILRPGGIEMSRRLIRVDAFDTKVKSMTGWVVRDGGETRKVTMKQAVATSLAPDTLYLDVKFLILSLPDVDVGSVVAFESEEVRTPASLEDSCELQGPFPVARARYELTLPLGWKADFHWVNREPADRTPDPKRPQTWSFEFKDIPAVPKEPQGPPPASLMGHLIVRVITAAQDGRSYTDWTHMGGWYEELSRDERVPDETVAAKANELAPAAKPSLERIRALAAFVQKEIRYVSIQIGIGGFEPHKAPSVLANRFGDCKDKATLLAALLEAIGVPSYYLIVNTDRGTVTQASPVSLYSFNHAILAIRLPDDIPDSGLDGLVKHPRWGRLLVFDPTMPTTPLGRLPFYLQDNTALLVAGDGGELVSLPRPSPESNVLDRQAKLTLTADGACAGEVQEVRRGSLADSYRYQLQASTEAERRKILETFLSRFFASFTLKDYDIRNLDDPQSDLIVSYRFTAPSYAKRAGGLLVIRPRVLGQKTVDLTSRAKGPRLTSIGLLETTALERDEFAFELPEGFVAEELPKPVDLEAGFAFYKSTTETSGRQLVYRREYRLREPTLPAARYDEAVKFYLAVGTDEKQVALVKQGVTGGK